MTNDNQGQVDLQVNVYGLNDPEDDMVMEGLCKTCGASLWVRIWTRKDCATMTSEQLVQMTIQFVMADHRKASAHYCRPN
jgi:hypothetical protein